MKLTWHRFWSKVERTDGCWLWIGATSSNGYGNFWNGSGTTRVHRWAYEALVGPVPEGLDLDHLCRVRNCVNPEHLEPVTRRENSLRGQSPTIAAHLSDTCAEGHSDWEYDRAGHRRCRPCRRAYARKYRASSPEYRARENERRRERRRAKREQAS